VTEVQRLVETYVVPLQLVMAMTGMGATLRVQDFALIARDPTGLLIGLGIQLIHVPIVAVAFIAVFDLSPGWAVGLLMVAAAPGGAQSNLFTHLARGSTALSIALTTVSSFLCIVTIPALLSLLARVHLPANFEFPTKSIVLDITLFLLLPVVAGMVIRRYWPRAALHVATWGVRGSVTLVIVIIVSALGTGRIRVEAYGFGPPLMLIAFGATLALTVPQICRLLGRYDDDNAAITIEAVIRNINIGLLLIHFFFPGEEAQGHMLYAILFYGGLAIPTALPTLLRHRRGKSPVLARRRYPRPARSETEESGAPVQPGS
jgi:BASS family bile acid:Na+ symporter